MLQKEELRQWLSLHNITPPSKSKQRTKEGKIFRSPLQLLIFMILLDIISIVLNAPRRPSMEEIKSIVEMVCLFLYILLHSLIYLGSEKVSDPEQRAQPAPPPHPL
jgi:hypothetical protein